MYLKESVECINKFNVKIFGWKKDKVLLINILFHKKKNRKQNKSKKLRILH